MGINLPFALASCGIVAVCVISMASRHRKEREAERIRSNLFALVPHHDATASPKGGQAPRPSKYDVLLLDNKHVPVGLIESVLQKHFRKDPEEAFDIRVLARRSGSAIAGTYPYEVGEQKIIDARKYLSHWGHGAVMALDRV